MPLARDVPASVESQLTQSTMLGMIGMVLDIDVPSYRALARVQGWPSETWREDVLRGEAYHPVTSPPSPCELRFYLSGLGWRVIYIGFWNRSSGHGLTPFRKEWAPAFLFGRSILPRESYSVPDNGVFWDPDTVGVASSLT